MQALIEVEAVSYRHPAPEGQTRPPALDGVSLSIQPGEYIALVGRNGSGKTTLARHLNGLLLPDTGRVLVDGMDTRKRESLPAVRAAVGMVFQQPEDQIVATTVAEDVAFGPENMGLPGSEVRRRVEEALRAVGMWEVRTRPPHLLSAGQIQRVALAGILAMRPRCIVFDETTAMLDPLGRRTVMETLRTLHAEGITVILITHFMDEAAQASRMVVMDRGKLALDASPRDIFADAAALDRLGLEPPAAARLAYQLRKTPGIHGIPTGILTLEELEAGLPQFQGDAGQMHLWGSEEPAGEALIEVEDLVHDYLRGTPMVHRALDGVSLTAAAGKAHGIAGATGSGKSTLLQHLNGLLRPQAGQVRVGPFNLNDLKLPLRTVCQTVGLVFQNPEMQMFETFVGDEIAFGPRQFITDRAELREKVRWAMAFVGLDFEEDKDRLTTALSGGERRKVALASTLAFRPSILVLDEPTAGLDPASRRDLRDRLNALKTAGTSLVISSHQMEDLALLADQMTLMAKGRDVLTGPVGPVFEAEPALREAGLEAPPVVRVAAALRAKGWPLPGGLLREADLGAALQEPALRLPWENRQ